MVDETLNTKSTVLDGNFSTLTIAPESGTSGKYVFQSSKENFEIPKTVKYFYVAITMYSISAGNNISSLPTGYNLGDELECGTFSDIKLMGFPPRRMVLRIIR